MALSLPCLNCGCGFAAFEQICGRTFAAFAEHVD